MSSRLDRLVERRGRKVHYYTDQRAVDGNGNLRPKTYMREGHNWWHLHMIDLIDRRVVTDREWGHSTITYTPRKHRAVTPARETMTERPPMSKRPDGMSRQTQRKLYRQLCQRLGVPWRRPGRDAS